jgi:mono/diheme cytochrome c family protein
MSMRARHAVAVAALAATAAVTQAQAPRTVQDGVYTAAQATRGGTVYGQQCASCHGATLQGASGPPLPGSTAS